MSEEWYIVEGLGIYGDKKIHIAKAEILVKAESVEDACVKARTFVSPIAEFCPTKCERKGD